MEWPLNRPGNMALQERLTIIEWRTNLSSFADSTTIMIITFLTLINGTKNINLRFYGTRTPSPNETQMIYLFYIGLACWLL